MMKKHLTKIVAATVAALVLLVTGCILSGQFIILLTVDGTINSTDLILDYVYVDLTTDETWIDHKDNIQGIEDLKFEAEFTNNLPAEATGQLYISTELYSSVVDVQDNATLILDGIVLPASESVEVQFSESGQFIHNLQTVLDLVEGGQFYVYGIASGVPFSVTVDGVGSETYARLMVTFSAGN